MPELPEVERTRLSLTPLIGRTITHATLTRTDICDSFNASGKSHRTTSGDLLQHARISHLTRRGKQLAIHADDGRTLCIQLGMSGNLRVLTSKVSSAFPKHTHAHWLFDNNSRLLFVDPRRFGGLSTYSTEQALLEHRWSTLGPDALTISVKDLTLASKKSHRPIKSLLLDQSALAGVGNIYADESLFLARINPSTHASALSKPQITALARAIRFILSRAIKAGGSTLRDYSDSAGTRGNAQLLHAVYARANKPCINCKRPLTSIRLAQRATVFCLTCQPPAAHVKST